MHFNRRSALQATALALAGAPALAGGAAAEEAAHPTMQAPGFYRFKVGSFLVTTVHDGYFDFPVDQLIPGTPLPQVQAILRESFLSPTVFHNPFTATLVQTPRDTILFDSGTGGQMGPQTGRMAQNLRAAGLDFTSVTKVILSHFHADHITGLVGVDGKAVFANAEIIVPEAEWRFWTDRTNETSSPKFQQGNFANVARRFAPYEGRIRQIASGTEVVPGIHAIAAPGHTPGMNMYRIADGGEQAIFIADVTHRPELFVRHPDLHAIIDFDPDLAERTRRSVLDMLATDRIRLTGYHYPFPANGYITRDASSYRFVAADWNSSV